jgi:hypothetical protein
MAAVIERIERSEMQEPDSPQEITQQNDSLTPPWIEQEGGELSNAGAMNIAPQLSDDEVAVSEAFVGRWNQLVSTTNWEKGKIISEWRAEIVERNAEIEGRTDEAWSELVGDVSPQHVGRLRRVFSRFGETHLEYKGLYWSHFLAAIDWDDAEMWLEGALREKWSIKQMQARRFETITSTRTGSGDVTHETISREEEAVEKERKTREPREFDDEYSGDSAASGPQHEGPDFGEEPARPKSAPEPLIGGEWADVSGSAAADQGPPLTWQNVPADLAESMEAVKLAIIKHKLSEWAEVSLESVLTNLEILKRIAMAS